MDYNDEGSILWGWLGHALDDSDIGGTERQSELVQRNNGSGFLVARGKRFVPHHLDLASPRL